MTIDHDWIAAWLNGVVSGRTIMSQRALSAVEKHGGLAAVIAAARQQGVHLVQLTDDHGKELVAASLKPFRVLC